MAFDDCKMSPIPGCPNYDKVYGNNQASQGTATRCNHYGNAVDCPDSYAGQIPGVSQEAQKNATGEVCVNAEYDGELVPAGWESKSCGQSAQTRGEDCGHSIPAYVKREDENVCVDVYEDDLNDATNRLNSLLDEKKAKESWRNDKYYCMYGATRFFMSLFQSDSLAYSDKYCGKASETSAVEPAVKEGTDRSFWEIMRRASGMMNEDYSSGS